VVHAFLQQPTESRPRTHLKRTEACIGILRLQRRIGNRGVGRVLQRQPTDEEYKPSPTAQWYIPWHFYGTLPGGPYASQGIAIDYDRIAPVPDPTKGADAQEQRRVFNTPALLEQLYHDATVPVGSSPNRRRALWFIGIIEAVAKEIGFDQARDMHKLGCLTIFNCGISWNKPLANFSDKTDSGLRVRGIALKSFIDKGKQMDANLQLINSALLLLGGVSAARAGLAKGTTNVATPPVKTPTSTPTPTAEPVKPTPPAEPVKPGVTAEPVNKAPVPAQTVTPSASPAAPRSPAEIVNDLKQAGLTQREIFGLTGGKRPGRLSPTRARAIDRLSKHFTPQDLKALGDYLAERKVPLSDEAVGQLIDGIKPGEMAAWVRKARIAEVHGEATRLPQDAKETSLGDEQDPKARVAITDKPSPAREPRPFLKGNFAHRFAEFLMDEARLPRPNQAEVVVELRDGTGDIIRVDRIVSTAERGLLYEIKPAGRSAARGRAQLPAREAALQREFPKQNGWHGDIVEYTRDDVAAWLRREAKAAREAGQPVPDVAKIMKVFGF
jgi:hypothetical protein